MTPFVRILVPHDFSEPAARALRFAAQLVPPGGQILVLHVVVPFVPVTDMPAIGFNGYISPAELVADAKNLLDRAIAKALPPKQAARVASKVVIGDPYQRIMATTRGMDAIVMSTAGRTGLAHLVIGSVTEKIVRHSPIPVITLRGAAGRTGAKRKARR
jgi:nucleotide-binding universal stress UspA family protein